MRQRGWCAAAACVCLCAARASQAQPAANQPEPAAAPANTPSQEGSTGLVAPDVRASEDLFFLRDGVFARMALGPGLFRSYNSSSDDRRVFKGVSTSLQLVVGGTIDRLVMMGVSYQRDQIWGLSAEDEVIDGDELDLDGYRMSLDTLGLFFDFYLGEKSGTHIQLMGGVGTLNVTRPSPTSIDDPTGGVLQLGVGHDWRLKAHTRAGIVAALTVAQQSVNESGRNADVRTFVPQLFAALTLN